MLKEIEEEEKAQVIRLGDASVASPFTSKLSTVMSGKNLSQYLKKIIFSIFPCFILLL